MFARAIGSQALEAEAELDANRPRLPKTGRHAFRSSTALLVRKRIMLRGHLASRFHLGAGFVFLLPLPDALARFPGGALKMLQIGGAVAGSGLPLLAVLVAQLNGRGAESAHAVVFPDTDLNMAVGEFIDGSAGFRHGYLLSGWKRRGWNEWHKTKRRKRLDCVRCCSRFLVGIFSASVGRWPLRRGFRFRRLRADGGEIGVAGESAYGSAVQKKMDDAGDFPPRTAD